LAKVCQGALVFSFVGVDLPELERNLMHGLLWHTFFSYQASELDDGLVYVSFAEVYFAEEKEGFVHNFWLIN